MFCILYNSRTKGVFTDHFNEAQNAINEAEDVAKDWGFAERTPDGDLLRYFECPHDENGYLEVFEVKPED